MMHISPWHHEKTFSVADNGDIYDEVQAHVRGEFDYIVSCYSGKLPDTFDYPLTIVVKVTNVRKQGMYNTNIGYGGTVTFYNASNGSFYYTNCNCYPDNYNGYNEIILMGNLTKTNTNK